MPLSAESIARVARMGQAAGEHFRDFGIPSRNRFRDTLPELELAWAKAYVRASAPQRLIQGRPVDAQTRCVHYRSDRDVVAIKFACCGRFYGCHQCHVETAGHSAQQWPADRRDERAVLCGRCRRLLTIEQYLSAGDRCVHCDGEFNPGCRTHRHLYFA